MIYILCFISTFLLKFLLQSWFRSWLRNEVKCYNLALTFVTSLICPVGAAHKKKLQINDLELFLFTTFTTHQNHIMEARSILKEHVLKTVSLADEEFDYFFSHFKLESFKKGQVIISDGQKGYPE